jgi:pimeloyl-ACP methyl ester carboxylesterase
MRVIAPDRPGYGSTGGRAIGIQANAEWAMALLDRLQIDRAVVVGHSWGSGIALAAALEYPQRLRALVLVGPMASTVLPSRLDRLFASRIIGAPATRLGFQAAGLGLTLPPLRRLAHIAFPAVEAERLKRIAMEWRGAGLWRSFYAEQRAFVEEMPALALRTPSLSVPTTIVTGNRDRICSPSQARRLASDLPNAELIEVRGGHLLPQQRPNVVADAIVASDSLEASEPDGQEGT